MESMEIKLTDIAQSDLVHARAISQGVRIGASAENLQAMADAMRLKLPEVCRFVILAAVEEPCKKGQPATATPSHIPPYKGEGDIVVHLPEDGFITQDALTIGVAYRLMERRSQQQSRKLRWTAGVISAVGSAAFLLGDAVAHSTEVSVAGAAGVAAGLGLGVMSAQPMTEGMISPSRFAPPLLVEDIPDTLTIVES